MPSAFEHGPAITVPTSNTTAKAAVIWSAASNLGESTIILDSGGNGRIGIAGDLDVITLTSGTVTVAGTVAATTLTGEGSGVTALNGTQVTTGTVPVAQLGSSGTRSSSTFLNGANAWAAPAGGIASVVADTTPQLGGNLDMQARLLVGNGGSTGIAISANGEVTMAAQPCFLAYNSVIDNNVTGDGTTFTVIFDTEVTDQNADFDGASTFTAPVTGTYLLSACVSFSQLETDADVINVLFVGTSRSGTCQLDNMSTNTSPSAAAIRRGTFILDMDTSDTCTITARVSNMSSGKVIDVDGGANLNTSFGGYLVA